MDKSDVESRWSIPSYVGLDVTTLSYDFEYASLKYRQSEGNIIAWVTRKFLFYMALLLALLPSVLKMYETSHWFREGDVSVYDDAKEWFDNPKLPFQSYFDSSKVLMRVYFFIIPYIFSAVFVVAARMIPASPMPASLHHLQQPRRSIGSFLRRSVSLPSFLVKLGLPNRLSFSELLGIAVFLVLNLGTMFVRVRRSLPRGSRKVTFLVDDGDAGKEPLDAYSWQAVEVWGKTLGVISIMNLGWYLLMPIGRKSVLLEAIGMSWERAVKYHRWVGNYSVLLMFIHSALYIAIWMHGNGNEAYDPDGEMMKRNMNPWYCSNNECDDDQARQLRVNMYGFATMFLVLIMTAMAVPWVRRHKFEWFYYAHHLFLLVFVFICLHYKGAIIYLVPGIAVYSIDKLMGLLSYRKSAPAKTRMVSSDVMELTFDIEPGVEYKAGDYVFLNVPGVSFLEWHPFSLTSAPNVNGNKVFFHLKDSGTWTKNVIEAAKTEARDGDNTLNVRLDGFYGNTDLFEHLQRKDQTLLVGGGIGVTPMISLAMGLCQAGTAPVTLIWVVRSIDEFSIFSTELSNALRRYNHLSVKVWITLSRPEPNNNDVYDARLEKKQIMTLSDLEQTDLISEALTSRPPVHNFSDYDVNKGFSVDPTFVMNQPGLSGATNAAIMCLSILIALIALAITSKMSREEKFEETIQDKISLLELAMVFTFVLAWVCVVVLVGRPSTRGGGAVLQRGPTLDDTAHYSKASSNQKESIRDSDSDIEGQKNVDVDDDIIMQRMILGRIGCRPNLPEEFTEILSEINMTKGDKKLNDVGVLACGPVQMVETINSICNMPSSGLKNQRSVFTFTEEDWEW